MDNLNTKVSGWTIVPVGIHYEVWLEYIHQDGSPSSLAKGPYFAFNREHAIKRGKSIFRREQSREEKRGRTESFREVVA